MRKKEGITLIALVVTIIVLLILAGISIQMLTGQNGLIRMARSAAAKTRVAQIEEQIDFAQIESMDMNTAELNKNKLIDKLNKIDGVLDVTEEGEDKVIVTYEGENGEVVKKEITVGKTVLASEKEFEDKIDETLDLGTGKTYDILYDAYGNIIENPVVKNDEKGNPITLWMYELRSGKEWQLNTDDRYSAYNHDEEGNQTDQKEREPAYNGEMKDGTIIGEIPAYIVRVVDGKIEHEGKVTSYKGIFVNRKDLTKWPDDLVVSPIIEKLQHVFDGTGITEIPEAFMTFSDEVKEINGLFANTAITEIPERFKIGKNVKYMEGLFAHTKIKKIPENFVIPDSVENCGYAFESCEELTEVGDGFKIGAKVTDVGELFAYCSKLTYVNFTIPSSVVEMHKILKYDYLINNKSKITIEGSPTRIEEAFHDTSEDFDEENPNSKGLTVYYHSTKCANISEIMAGVAEGKVEFIDLDQQNNV